MKISKPFGIALISIVVLPACNIIKRGSIHVEPPSDRLVEATTPFENENDALDVLNGQWIIIEANGSPVVQRDEDNPVQVTFELNNQGLGTLYCYTGCNYLNGDVAFIPSRNIVEPRGNYMSTMMACDPEAEATQRAITLSFTNMRKFVIDHSNLAYNLELIGNEGNTLLKARRWDNDFLNGAWEVTAIGNKEVNHEDDMQLVLDIPLGRVHGNTGCNILNGTLRLDPDHPGGIEFSNIAVTQRACPDRNAALERSLLVALEGVATVKPSTDGEDAFMQDAEGKTLINLHRLILKR